MSLQLGLARFTALFARDAVKLVISLIVKIGKPLVDAIMPVILNYRMKIQVKIPENIMKKIYEEARETINAFKDRNDLRGIQKLEGAAYFLKAKTEKFLETEKLQDDVKKAITEELKSSSFWLWVVQEVYTAFSRFEKK